MDFLDSWILGFLSLILGFLDSWIPFIERNEDSLKNNIYYSKRNIKNLNDNFQKKTRFSNPVFKNGQK